MFGEVYDADPKVTSTYTTTRPARRHARLRLPGRGASASPQGRPDHRSARLLRRRRLLHRHRLERLRSCRPSSATTTWAGSAPSSPAAPAADDASCRRDQLAHELMFLTRGQPVVYYGDEQGFTGAGGDKDARQDMFASRGRRRTTTTTCIGTDAHPRRRPTSTPRTRSTGRSPSSPRSASGTRRCATAPSSTATRAAAPASTRFSRIAPEAEPRVRRRGQQRRDGADAPPSTP